MLLDYMRLVNASKKFKIKDQFEFLELDDIIEEDKSSKLPEHLEIWASIKIHFEGDLPESYKALNLLIGDWVEHHKNKLTQVIHSKLKGHLSSKYPKAIHDLDTDESSIWEDQLDYMPRTEEGNKSIDIDIELVLETEPVEE